jgi:hypothetical protein
LVNRRSNKMVKITSTKMMKKFFAAREFFPGVRRFHYVDEPRKRRPGFSRHCERSEAIHRPQAKAGLLRRWRSSQ